MTTNVPGENFDPAYPEGVDFVELGVEENEEEQLSECCGAEIMDEIGLCSDCKEHCE